MSATASVLVVDDEAGIRRLLRSVLQRAGYATTEAPTAQAAEDALEENAYDVALVDVLLGHASGLALAARVEEGRPDTAVVMMSGADDPGSQVAAIDAGAYGFLLKPFSNSELLIAVKNALRRRDLEQAHRRREAELAEAVAARTAELVQSREETILRLAAAAEAHDPDARGHLDRVGELSRALAHELALGSEREGVLRLASMLHDVGKIAVPQDLLRKPGPLTPDERALVERHTTEGHRILSGTHQDVLETAAMVALTHHERLDGSGYPNGLVGEAIPLEGRIVAVADVFDALTSTRAYRGALSWPAALSYVRASAGTLFDDAIVEALVRVCEALA